MNRKDYLMRRNKDGSEVRKTNQLYRFFAWCQGYRTKSVIDYDRI